MKFPTFQTFRGTSGDYIDKAMRKVAFKQVHFTDIVRGGDAFYHLPGDITCLEATVSGRIPLGGELRYLQELEEVRIWFKDDEALHSILPELPYLTKLRTLEIGWVGAFHQPGSIISTLKIIRQLTVLEYLCLYFTTGGPSIPVSILNDTLEGCLLRDLVINGATFDLATLDDSLLLCPSIERLYMIDCSSVRVDIKRLRRLRLLCAQPANVNGLEDVQLLEHLQTLILEDMVLMPEFSCSISDAMLAHYGVRLPPSWARPRLHERRLSV